MLMDNFRTKPQGLTTRLHSLNTAFTQSCLDQNIWPPRGLLFILPGKIYTCWSKDTKVLHKLHSVFTQTSTGAMQTASLERLRLV